MKHLHKILRIFGIRTHRRFRLILRGAALLIGIVAAYQATIQLEEKDYIEAAYFYLFIVAAAFLEFTIADGLADRSYPIDTERKLELMERKLGSQVIEAISRRLLYGISKFKGCDTARISATVHVLAELPPTVDQRNRQGLLQLTDYVGPEGGTKGRITHVAQGVIGRCARTGRIEAADFAGADEYRTSMVRDFGFTQLEAEHHTKTGRSYLAYPLKRKNKTVGVLYFFTSEPQVFPRAADAQQLEEIAGEIITYIEIAGIA